MVREAENGIGKGNGGQDMSGKGALSKDKGRCHHIRV